MKCLTNGSQGAHTPPIAPLSPPLPRTPLRCSEPRRPAPSPHPRDSRRKMSSVWETQTRSVGEHWVGRHSSLSVTLKQR